MQTRVLQSRRVEESRDLSRLAGTYAGALPLAAVGSVARPCAFGNTLEDRFGMTIALEARTCRYHLYVRVDDHPGDDSLGEFIDLETSQVTE